MARWKATSKGFPTGHLRRPSEVVEPNLEQRKVGMEMAIGMEMATAACIYHVQMTQKLQQPARYGA